MSKHSWTGGETVTFFPQNIKVKDRKSCGVGTCRCKGYIRESLVNREAELGFGISKGRSHIVKWETTSHGLGGTGRSEAIASSRIGELGRPGIQVQVEWPIAHSFGQRGYTI